MALFALIGLASIGFDLRARRGSAGAVICGGCTGRAARLPTRGNAPQLVACAAISAVASSPSSSCQYHAIIPRSRLKCRGTRRRQKTWFTRTCMYCHSNETPWPWYAYFGSRVLAHFYPRDERAPTVLTFPSEQRPSIARRAWARDMADAIRNGNMPPVDFVHGIPKRA